jgi:hypothetical protein
MISSGMVFVALSCQVTNECTQFYKCCGFKTLGCGTMPKISGTNIVTQDCNYHPTYSFIHSFIHTFLFVIKYKSIPAWDLRVPAVEAS